MRVSFKKHQYKNSVKQEIDEQLVKSKFSLTVVRRANLTQNQVY